MEIVKLLMDTISPNELQEMITAGNYEAFINAAEIGHIEIVRLLMDTITPDKLQDMIAAENYYAFQCAADNGHIEIVKLLIATVAPDKLQEMIAADEYYAFRWAAENDHIEVLKHLYMVTEDIKLPSEEFDKINSILSEEKIYFNLNDYKNEIAKYRYEYNLLKLRIEAAKKLASFMAVSKNETLELAFTPKDENESRLALPKDITKHILSYVVRSSNFLEKQMYNIIDNLHNRKQSILTKLKQEDAIKKTFVEGIRREKEDNNNEVSYRN